MNENENRNINPQIKVLTFLVLFFLVRSLMCEERREREEIPQIIHAARKGNNLLIKFLT
jgi:hypothetical protein